MSLPQLSSPGLIHWIQVVVLQYLPGLRRDLCLSSEPVTYLDILLDRFFAKDTETSYIWLLPVLEMYLFLDNANVEIILVVKAEQDDFAKQFLKQTYFLLTGRD